MARPMAFASSPIPAAGGWCRTSSMRMSVFATWAIRSSSHPHYTNFSGELIPEYRDITLRNVHILTPGEYIVAGFDAQHELGVTLDNVFADGLDDSHVLAEYANITMGSALGNLEPQGSNVTVGHTPSSRPGSALACGARFVPFPSIEDRPATRGRGPSGRQYAVCRCGRHRRLLLHPARDRCGACQRRGHLRCPRDLSRSAHHQQAEHRAAGSLRGCLEDRGGGRQEFRHRRRHAQFRHRECAGE